MLRARIITAVLLFSTFISALFLLPSIGWVVFATLVAAVAAWEWGAIMAFSGISRLLLAIVFILVCAVISVLEPAALGLESGFADAAWRLGRWFYLPAVVFWLIVVPFWMRRRWSVQKSPLGLLTGVIVLLPTWLAMIQLRQAGPVTLIAVMATVWLADIGAYVFGRSLGRHKMAPNISPGKTWEGAIGGGLVVIAYGFLLSRELPVFFAGNSALLLIVLVLLTAISVIGDLFESLLKRQAGLKDSGNVLPGHGGVLDRIDSLTSTLPSVVLLWLTLLY